MNSLLGNHQSPDQGLNDCLGHGHNVGHGHYAGHGVDHGHGLEHGHDLYFSLSILRFKSDSESLSHSLSDDWRQPCCSQIAQFTDKLALYSSEC